LDDAKLGGTGRIGSIPKNSRSRHAGGDLLEQLQPFAAHAVFPSHEASGVAARPCQGVDEAGGDRIRDDWEYDAILTTEP
jgi:hypothetical protein